LDEIVSKAEKLDRYEQYWAEQEMQRENEDLLPEDKVSKLEQRLDELIDKQESEKKAKTEREQAVAALNGFKSEVNSHLSKQDVPEEYQPFLAEYSGVDNRFNEVDITDKPGIRAMLNANIKRIQDFEQAVIKRYRDGKIQIPKISETTPVDNTPKPEPVKNLKEAKTKALEILRAAQEAKARAS